MTSFPLIEFTPSNFIFVISLDLQVETAAWSRLYTFFDVLYYLYGDYISFELLSFVIRGNIFLLRIVIYRPPKSNANWIRFSKLLSLVMP